MATDRRRAARSFNRLRTRLGVAATRVVAARFADEERSVVAQASAGVGPSEIVIDVVAWVDTLAAVWMAAIPDAYDATYTRLTGEPPPAGKVSPRSELTALLSQIVGWRYPPVAAVNDFLDERARGIITTTRRRLSTVLRDIPLTDTRNVQAAIRALYRSDFARDRAARIALNEAATAANAAADAAARAAAARTGGRFVYRRVWTALLDESTRPPHAVADGQEVDMDTPFDVDGEALMVPRDPAGSPGNTINCRCYVEHVRRTAEGGPPQGG